MSGNFKAGRVKPTCLSKDRDDRGDGRRMRPSDGDEAVRCRDVLSGRDHVRNARTLSTRTVETRGEGSSQKRTDESGAKHGECLVESDDADLLFPSERDVHAWRGRGDSEQSLSDGRLVVNNLVATGLPATNLNFS